MTSGKVDIGPENRFMGTVDVGAKFTEEQIEWLRACESYRSEHNLKFLLARDFLNIAKKLGYVKR